jgi:hypothetical protein
LHGRWGVLLARHGALEVRYEWIEGAVAIVGQALRAQAQGLRDARLANASLTRQEHHLALTLPGLFPAPQQDIDFSVAFHQGREPGGGGRLEAALGGARSAHPVDPYGIGQAFKQVCGDIIVLKRSTHQPLRLCTEHQPPWCGQALQPRRNIRRLP